MSDRIGLCASCAFARVIESARASRFTLCRRSETDARFPRYPALPVLDCVGYEKGDSPSEEHDQTQDIDSP